MKVFWNQNSLGHKAQNIFLLQKNGFCIPETVIVWSDFFENFECNFLSKKYSYILRPSFEDEDGKNLSQAGKYTSLFPLSQKDVQDFFAKKDFWAFGWDQKFLKSIIIQRYIKNAIFWVFFTRHPDNIFYDGFFEVADWNDTITWGKTIWNHTLSFFQSQELKIYGNKLESLLKSPQDIEFCFYKNTLIFLQSRPITTWIHSKYHFWKIQKIHGIYTTLDFDELWKEQTSWEEHVLSPLFNVLLLGKKLYFKKSFLPYFLWKKIPKNLEKNHFLFLKNYQKYLRKKYIFWIIKFFCFQKLDLKILDNFFGTYHYYFDKNTASFLDLNFQGNTNWITRQYLAIEKQKQMSFLYLENYKKTSDFSETSSSQDELFFEDILVFSHGKIQKNSHFCDSNRVYPWKIQGILVDESCFDPNKKNQVFISQNLDFSLYDKIHALSWVIIQNGNKLSHNSIVLREYKIPSIIRYPDFEKLHVWDIIEIE